MSDAIAELSTDARQIADRIPVAPGEVRGSRTQIADVVALVAREFRPERVVLFGSRAYGTPHAGSDVDLMVIMETPMTPSAQAWAIREAIGHVSSFRVDVHVRTPEQIRVGLAEGDFFIEDVMQGITLYARAGMTRLEAADNGGRRPAQGSGLKEATLDWLRKAEGDARSARILFEAPDPVLDNVCFLAQQCVEKLLKALLQEQGIRFPRTHVLVELAKKAQPILPGIVELEEDLRDLTSCVEARYPDVDVSEEKANRAMRTMASVRSLVRPALGLPPEANE